MERYGEFEHVTGCVANDLLEEIKILREKLSSNCSKSKFHPEWQGGYDDGVADGGDVKYVCRECEMDCVELDRWNEVVAERDELRKDVDVLLDALSILGR